MSKLKEISLLIAVLGLWLIATPLSFGPQDPFIFYNDITCGILLIILGVASFCKGSWVYFFPFSLIGLWLNFAPLAFWAPRSIEYLNDTLIGLIILIFAFQFIPSLKKDKAVQPPGWSFNPSEWSHRVPIIFLAVICWLCARYLDGFELGYYDMPWDPFFGQGTLKVLSSKVSRSFPIPDAGLGALAYSLEAILCWQGGQNRWKTTPWLVLTFGILALPVSIVSIILILLQPLVVDAWCFLCLCIAFLMAFIVMLASAEVLATLQCLKKARAKGSPFLPFLLFGSQEQDRPSSPNPHKYPRGIAPTWNLSLIPLLAIAMIVIATQSDISHFYTKTSSVLGALIIFFSLLSFSEILRPLRYLNVVLGLLVGALAFFLLPSHLILFLVSLSLGIAFMALSFPRGKIKEHYGSWDKLII